MPVNYLVFTEASYLATGKTKVWRVGSTSGSHLGWIKWFGRWRQYCFYPAPETIFNKGCLTEIASFCADRMAERRARFDEEDTK